LRDVDKYFLKEMLRIVVKCSIIAA
jgi:hypothetical protein